MTKRMHVLWLVGLVLQAACATPVPVRGRVVDAEYEVALLESGPRKAPPVAVAEAEFAETWRALARDRRVGGTPQEEARRALGLGWEEEWLAEVEAGRVLSLSPVEEAAALTPEAANRLRGHYLAWCARRGGGDCLGLLDDGPVLREEDRRTLALALAFGEVLEETRRALEREVSARALVATVVWTVGLYLTLWLLPEPSTKGVAASVTVVLVGWLGVDTVWGLMEGWTRLCARARAASTFEELREAGEAYARVMGQDTARMVVLAVAALTGRAAEGVAARVRALPGFPLARVGWAAAQEGVAVAGLAEVAQAVESVGVAARGALVVVSLKAASGGGAASGSGGPVTVIRHQGGNRQVVLGNGQRWHLPRGKSSQDIPGEDRAGDQLQEAVTQAARQWGPDKLSRNEDAAIKKALKAGEYWLARLLEREARGRFVHDAVKKRFEGRFKFNPKGVDVLDPATGFQYELLSGSESNLARHGRRMAGDFFRMLTF
ncbi:hypothetical protein [Archangium primigenium]|uniref:SitA5 family polymorphic toxin n=1 Tax=[Archangium] primigenium TaxID=2792470 RepID=UPI0023BAFA1C|nr:hypothetical protein [Archangium primigenium]